MAQSPAGSEQSRPDPAALPFVAPCRELPLKRPLKWDPVKENIVGEVNGGWAVSILLALVLLAGGWRRLSMNRINRLVGHTQ